MIGYEQGGRRPGLIVSSDLLHVIPSQLVYVVPITTRDRGIESHVPIVPPVGGLRRPSFAMTEQLRAVSKQRLQRRLGVVSPEILAQTMARVRLFLDL